MNDLSTLTPPALHKPHHPTPAAILRVCAVVLLFVALKGAGNLSLAWGMKHFPQAMSADPIPYIRAMFDPFVAAGIGAFILALLVRMALLSLADLSFVVPVTAVGYFVAAFLGKTFLHETVSAQRWFGTALIFFGAALVGSTPHSTTDRKAK
jgi:drug/metabolite transporter (DMT)-like permease